MATDQYAQRVFDFFDRINALSREDEIVQEIIGAAQEFGYEFMTIWTAPPPGRPLDAIMLNTRPPSFVEHYIEKNYVSTDPVVVQLRRSLKPCSWSDIRKSVPLKPNQLRIMDEAREFDVRDGFTIPIVTASGAVSVVSPCGRDPDLSSRGRSAFELIAMMAYQALRRVQTENAKNAPKFKPLTAREKEVLQLVADGCTDAEISERLNIRQTTVLAHVENAKRKLDSTKRTQAIVIALRRNEISI